MNDYSKVKRIEANKTARELGYNIGDRFKVVEGNGYVNKGDIISLLIDDDSDCPYFRVIESQVKENVGDYWSCGFHRLIEHSE